MPVNGCEACDGFNLQVKSEVAIGPIDPWADYRVRVGRRGEVGGAALVGREGDGGDVRPQVEQEGVETGSQADRREHPQTHPPADVDSATLLLLKLLFRSRFMTIQETFQRELSIHTRDTT